MPSFQVQKVLNYRPLYDGGWRIYKYGYSHPYHWHDGNGFGVEGFYAGYDPDDASNYIRVTPSSNHLLSDYFDIQNVSTFEYTFSITARSGTEFSPMIKVLEYGYAGTLLVTNTKNFAVTDSWEIHTWTISSHGDSDITLNGSTTGLVIRLEGAPNEYWIRDIKVLGETCELSKGWFMPLDEDDKWLQDVGYNAAGDIRARGSWNDPVKVFKLNRDKFLKEDYIKMYNFLNNPDIKFGRFPCLYTDDLDNTYWGRFDTKSMKFDARSFQNALINLSWKELPY